MGGLLFLHVRPDSLVTAVPAEFHRARDCELVALRGRVRQALQRDNAVLVSVGPQDFNRRIDYLATAYDCRAHVMLLLDLETDDRIEYMMEPHVDSVIDLRAGSLLGRIAEVRVTWRVRANGDVRTPRALWGELGKMVRKARGESVPSDLAERLEIPAADTLLEELIKRRSHVAAWNGFLWKWEAHGVDVTIAVSLNGERSPA